MISEVIDQRARWLRDLPARTALKFCNRPEVRGFLGKRYASALQTHRSHMPKLSAFDQKIVDAVDRDGVFITSLEEMGLPNSAEILKKAQELTAKFADEARDRAARGETFVFLSPDDIVSNPDIFYFGLQDRLLDIAENYIGLAPAYDGVVVNYTVADGKEVSTRKWHRDWEDRRMLKFAFYLNDVDSTGGPFQLVKRSETTHGDANGYYYNLADDKDLEGRFGTAFKEDIVNCEGPAGTVIFADTARFFHRGKPATGRDRSAVFYSYFASHPRHPFLCERTGLKRKDLSHLAKDLPQRQREAALWRRQLSPALQIIPPAKL